VSSGELIVRIESDGTAAAIYDDKIAPVLEALGRARIARASHVEPTSDGWWIADLTPSQGPVLGPFRRRRDALDAERRWLERAMMEESHAHGDHEFRSTAR
jgi:hypothetical protein